MNAYKDQLAHIRQRLKELDDLDKIKKENDKIFFSELWKYSTGTIIDSETLDLLIKAHNDSEEMEYYEAEQIMIAEHKKEQEKREDDEY